MSDVHEALKALSPAEHHNFPRSPSTLDVHLASHLSDTHTLISSVPPPIILPPNLSLPDPPHADSKALQQEWKPVKMNAKDNPLNISVFKLAAKDGKGAWFARRSIHTDIPFARFKAGLQKEFEQPKKEGGGGTGAIRGIGKDEMIHNHCSDLGKAEVLVLSAQFPGPSAPRVFVEGYLSSSAHPEDLSNATANGEQGGSADNCSSEQRPRQFTVISKPLLGHPDVPDRPGHVLGMYESVEFIREIPISPKQLERSQSTPSIPALVQGQSTTRPRGNTVAATPEESRAMFNHLPVEWIMITRSDPGGSVPRWMVERGTPGGIVKDAEKFLKWARDATHLDEFSEAADEATDAEMARGEDARNNNTVPKRLSEQSLDTTAEQPEEEKPSASDDIGNSSLLSRITAGMTSLAASAVSTSAHPTPPPSESDAVTPPYSEATPSDMDDSDTASLGSFTTALSYDVDIPEPPSRTASFASTTLPRTETPEARALNHFLKEKTKLEEKLQREELKRMEKERKATEKHLKNMEKRERKYRRAVEKAEERRRKEADKRKREGAVSREEKGWREVGELKKVVEELTRENLELRNKVEMLEKERQVVSTKEQGEQ